jgi:trehalose 6-phosphate phosphatase
MRYLFDDTPMLARIISTSGAFLLLDYDGTLVEMAPTPELAILSDSRRDLLRQLAKCAHYRVAVISGRDLDELKGIVGVDGIFYSGSHGLELEGPGVFYRHNIQPQYMAILHKMTDHIRGLLGNIEGVMIERKKFSLCVHYRLCSAEQSRVVRHMVAEAVTGLVADGDIRVMSGRRNIEIVPPCDWNKGKIAIWLLDEYHTIHPGCTLMPIFLGDDSTDETAFEALCVEGMTVFVGRHRPSSAQYYLRDVSQVYEFLAFLANGQQYPTDAVRRSECS